MQSKWLNVDVGSRPVRFFSCRRCKGSLISWKCLYLVSLSALRKRLLQVSSTICYLRSYQWSLEDGKEAMSSEGEVRSAKRLRARTLHKSCTFCSLLSQSYTLLAKLPPDLTSHATRSDMSSPIIEQEAFKASILCTLLMGITHFVCD